jgi:uncharacterized membrane protein YbhN (UPF0104 family)
LRLPSKRSALHIAKIVFAVAVTIAIVVALVRQWGDVRAAIAAARPRWGYIALSCLLVLGTYALLIEAWLVLLTAWEPTKRIGFRESARIWTVSNLGRYIPGKVWALGSMAVMVQGYGISGIAAVGSALLNQLINTLAGFVILAATGATVLHVPPAGTIAIAALGAGLLLTPQILPWLGRIATRLTKRDIPIPRLPHRAIWLAALVHAASWIVYGIAFRTLAAGLLGHSPGAPGLYIAVFTGSYLVGFLTLIAPGGVGVREVIMGAALQRAGFAPGEAILLVVASRIWLTVLEIVPAVLFLSHRWVRQRRSDGSIEITH